MPSMTTVLPPRDRLDRPSNCSDRMREEGKAYPRTCARCRLGPCVGRVSLTNVEPPPLSTLPPGMTYRPLAETNPNFHPALTSYHLARSCGRDDKEGMLYFYDLASAAEARGAVWTGKDNVGNLFRLVEHGGEAGEVFDALLPFIELGAKVGKALNTGKKLHREEMDWAGSRTSKAALASELADVVITAQNAAMEAGIDLDAALVEKFNETSDKVGIKVKLIARPRSLRAT
jgi:NTP pyrophosphatase (non-canonical NTP hydrolase)